MEQLKGSVVGSFRLQGKNQQLGDVVHRDAEDLPSLYPKVLRTKLALFTLVLLGLITLRSVSRERP